MRFHWYAFAYMTACVELAMHSVWPAETAKCPLNIDPSNPSVHGSLGDAGSYWQLLVAEQPFQCLLYGAYERQHQVPMLS